MSRINWKILGSAAAARPFVPALVLLFLLSASAQVQQPTSPNIPGINTQSIPAIRDPLMNLMLAQPKIELFGPLHAVSGFDPPLVQPGEKSIYHITFNALEQTIQLPRRLPAPPALTLEPGAHGQVLQLLGPTMEPRTTFNFRARAYTTGSFTIPQFSLVIGTNHVDVPAATLEVASNF